MTLIRPATPLKGTPTAMPIPLRETARLLDVNTVVIIAVEDAIFEAIDFALLYFLLSFW